MLIVEGPDNSGKSTLVRRLAEDARLLLIAQKRKPRTRDEYFDFLNRMIPLSRQWPTIFDRWTPISEAVYGPVIRGKSMLSDRDLEVAMAAPLLAGLKPTIIYCRPSDETITTTIRERDQMRGVPENIERIIHAYDRVMDHWGHTPTNSYPTIRYDFRDPAAYRRVLDRALTLTQETYL